MGLVAKASGGNFVPVPPGMWLARCYRVVDLGTQRTEYLGKEKHLPKVMIQFEVHGEDDKGNPLVTSKNEPMTISKNFTLSLAEKATLRIDLKSWRGRDFTPAELAGFELKNVLGAWAMIAVATSIGKDGNEYTNITSINPVPKQIKDAGLPEAFNDPAMFSIEDPDMTMFDTFSDGLKKKIMQSPEWIAREGGVAPAPAASGKSLADLDDDIPF